MYLMVLGGESIYGHPFKDEFHSRLRFVRRGLVAMANAGKDDNARKKLLYDLSLNQPSSKLPPLGNQTYNANLHLAAVLLQPCV